MPGLAYATPEVVTKNCGGTAQEVLTAGAEPIQEWRGFIELSNILIPEETFNGLKESMSSWEGVQHAGRQVVM